MSRLTTQRTGGNESVEDTRRSLRRCSNCKFWVKPWRKKRDWVWKIYATCLKDPRGLCTWEGDYCGKWEEREAEDAENVLK